MARDSRRGRPLSTRARRAPPPPDPREACGPQHATIGSTSCARPQPSWCIAAILRPAKARDRDRTGDLTLTKGVLCRLSYASDLPLCGEREAVRAYRLPRTAHLIFKRETGLEPATSSLEGLRSTS